MKENMLNFMTWVLPIYWSKKKLIARRKYFFESILDLCSSAPDSASEVMGQNVYNVLADKATATMEPDKGILIFSIPAEFYGIPCHHTYSLWQIGDLFKVGLLLSDGLETAPVIDHHREIGELWHGVPYRTIEKGSSTLYEWTFKVPHLYATWSEQEQYILGMGHCKQRILRIIHDYALLKSEK